MADKTKSRGDGPANPNWKGGRVVEPRGYVIIRVGKDHPLADCRGYAYEHRLVAQAAADKPLTSKDIVHHDDEIKSSNAPENLEVTTRQWHRVAHRKHDKGLRLPNEENPQAQCECGCGREFPKFDSSGRPRRFVSGHNVRHGEDGRWTSIT